jgi:hypothetical protein
MPKYAYLVVEGPHDVEFIYRLLKPYRFARVRMLGALDPFFAALVPRTFPPDGDLQKRVPIPVFLQNETHSVAVHSAVGDTRLIQTIEENAGVLDSSALTAIGVIFACDSALTPNERYRAIRDGLRAKGYGFPDDAGALNAGVPNLGAFVLPDNRSSGSLENILLECAQHVYPALLSSAITHVESALEDASLTVDDLHELTKPAGRDKAIVSAIASILRPGRATQDSALALPRVEAVQSFLVNLLELQ